MLQADANADASSQKVNEPPEQTYRPQLHYLKTQAEYWDAVESGAKTFEVRKDDRGFQRGDILILQRLCPITGGLDTGATRFKTRDIRRRVTWILTGGKFGIEPGYVVMGLGNSEVP